MHECLAGTLAAGAGGGSDTVPGRVCSEVALSRSHLIQPARGRLV